MAHLPPYPPDFRLCLASQSPRRHSLLRELGVPYEVVSAEVEETLAGGSAAALAEGNALAKVRAASVPADAPPGAFILGTDTVVSVEDSVLGKPASAVEAAGMLRALAGRTHQVVSGVALARTGGCDQARPGADAVLPVPPVERVWVAHAVTAVTFLPLDERAVAAYVASREWVGKAGGYAVQGLAATFVSGIEGEYSNVVGLPLCLLARLLREAGFDLLGREWV